MENILSFIENSLPSVSIMVIGFLTISLANGAFGAKVLAKTKKILLGLGYIIFLSGFVITLSISIFQTKKSYPNEISATSQFLSPLFSWKTFLIFTLIFIATLIIRKLRIFSKIRSYSLSAVPTLSEVDQFDIREPIITITNKSDETIECRCKIESFYIDDVEKNIDDINPKGEFMSWGNKDFTMLRQSIPQSINIASGFGDKVEVSFSNQEFDVGNFDFLFGFYRMSNGKMIRFSEFAGTFTATYIKEKDRMVFDWR